MQHCRGPPSPNRSSALGDHLAHAPSRWRRLAARPAPLFLFAILLIGGPFVLANVVSKLWMTDPALHAFRNPFKTAVLLAAYCLFICLTLAYLATRRLWLCVGLHWGWNFAQGGLFSLPVSGNVLWPGLPNAQVQGPEWATGGAFGVEASPITLVLTALLCFHFWRQAHQRGHLRSTRQVTPSEPR